MRTQGAWETPRNQLKGVVGQIALRTDSKEVENQNPLYILVVLQESLFNTQVEGILIQQFAVRA